MQRRIVLHVTLIVVAVLLEGSELTEVIHGDLVLHPSFAAGLQNPNFLVLSRPIGNFPLRVTVLRDNVVVQVKEGTPGAVVGMWLQF